MLSKVCDYAVKLASEFGYFTVIGKVKLQRRLLAADSIPNQVLAIQIAVQRRPGKLTANRGCD